MSLNEEKKTEELLEEALKEQLNKAYLRGLAVGGKTFVGSVYDIILKGKKQKLNPAKVLLKIESTCKRLLSVAEDYEKKDLTENIIEAVEREKNKNEEVVQ